MHRYFVCYFLVQVIMQIIITSNKLYMPWKKILIFVCLLVIQLFVCTQYLEDFLVYVLHDLEGYIWFNNLRRTLLYFYCDQFFFSIHHHYTSEHPYVSTTFISNSKINLVVLALGVGINKMRVAGRHIFCCRVSEILHTANTGAHGNHMFSGSDS